MCLRGCSLAIPWALLLRCVFVSQAVFASTHGDLEPIPELDALEEGRPAAAVAVINGPADEAGPADAPEEFTELLEVLPASVEDCTSERVEQMAAASQTLDDWANRRFWEEFPESSSEMLELTTQLVEIKTAVDRQLEDLLELRTQFALHQNDEGIRDRMCNYLAMTSQMLDLSGRLRYLLRDVILEAAYANETSPAGFSELIELLTEHRAGIGAVILAEWLFDAPTELGLEPLSANTKESILDLIAVCGEVSALPELAAYALDRESQPALVLRTAEVIREIGLPQAPSSDQDPTLPSPAITAEQLSAVLTRLDTSDFSREQSSRLEELVKWLTVRRIDGVTEQSYHYGAMDIRPGDWLLMRNPSPYNLFTDLSPGLFTHVGVVTAVTGEDGIRRFVVVDLPERGTHMPATNVDIFLERTLSYVFLRHPQPTVGERMGEVAASVIGNETEFDLNFRGDRVEALRGQPLEGQLIHTYCAGLLLLCAQETNAPRVEFFPFEEFAATGHTAENLATLGLSIGERFVSPTGALFSQQLQIAGRRESMYEPTREIQSTIYDHFAERMREKVLTPNPDAFQALRQKLAEVSQSNAWLARALARVSDVNERMDLESAAKTAAVVETLDEIAIGNADEFYQARVAIQAGPLDGLAVQGATEEEIATVEGYRETHAAIYQAWEQEEITPQDLRARLVEYYIQRGNEQLDERFFSGDE